MSGTRAVEKIHTVVIGGGQAGLSVGYFLARRGIPFVILDAAARIGDAWRTRWDSLRLFTPARYDGLVGMPFPAPGNSFPTKDEMADYLESYAAHFRLPVRTGVRVDRVWKEAGQYRISAGDVQIEAKHVVMAMANLQTPRVPGFASGLAPEITQLHSKDYRNTGQLRPGAVLIVGAGNSGAEIAAECAGEGRQTLLSGRDVGELPFNIKRTITQTVVMPLIFRVVFHRVLTMDTPMGRRVKQRSSRKGTVLIRQKADDLRAAGVERLSRVTGARAGKPILEDGRALDVANVIWCTGFESGLSWIDLPIFDEHGEPIHERGLVPNEPGISFVGRHFLYAMSSTMIHGVARDAEHVADAIAAPAGGAVYRSPARPVIATAS